MPFGFVKLGLNIGSMFGLDKSISEKINTMLEENVSDVVDVTTENGEHITITLV